MLFSPFAPFNTSTPAIHEGFRVKGGLSKEFHSSYHFIILNKSPLWLSKGASVKDLITFTSVQTPH